MKVLVIGATGRVGTLLVQYALEQGHHVTAFARNVDAYPFSHEHLTIMKGDVLYPFLVEAAIQGHEAVLSVIGVRRFEGEITLLSTGTRHIVEAMSKTGVRRLITITGAGILQETPDRLIMDSLSFPPNLQNISMDHRRMYDTVRASELDWTIVCPAFMRTGEQTGSFLVKGEYYPEQAQNQVSAEDVAAFILQEMVENAFVKQRVGIAHPL